MGQVKKFSEEHRAKLRASARRRWARKHNFSTQAETTPAVVDMREVKPGMFDGLLRLMRLKK